MSSDQEKHVEAVHAVIMGVLLLSGLIGLGAAGQRDDEEDEEFDDDKGNSSSDEDSAVYIFELSLTPFDASINEFEPDRDQVVITTQSLDLDFALETTEEGSTLFIEYGDVVSSITGPWLLSGIGDSVVIRHLDGGSEGSTDYHLRLVGDDEDMVDRDRTVSVYMSDSTTIDVISDQSVVSFGADVVTAEISGEGNFGQGDIDVSSELASFEYPASVTVYGAEKGGEYVLRSGSFEFYSGAGSESIAVIDGSVEAHLGGSDDWLDASGGSSSQSRVIVYGGVGRDWVSGSTGDDFIDGGRDDDTIFGNAGSDTLVGSGGADVVYGGSGDDLIFGAKGNITRSTGSGVLWSDFVDVESDSLFGGSGDDTIHFGSSDTAFGGSGNDEFVVYLRLGGSEVGTIGDFDPASETIEIGLSFGDSLALEKLVSEPSDLADHLSWEQAAGQPSVYLLVLDNVPVLRVISEETPTLDCVSFFVIDAID